MDKYCPFWEHEKADHWWGFVIFGCGIVCEIQGFVKIMLWRFNWHVSKFDWVVNDVMKRCEMRDRLSSLKWPHCFLLQCHIVLPWFLCQGGHDGEASCYLLVWHLDEMVWFPRGSWPKGLSYLKLNMPIELIILKHTCKIKHCLRRHR